MHSLARRLTPSHIFSRKFHSSNPNPFAVPIVRFG